MTSFEERYAKLNKEQKEAVDTLKGPVMVIAGPGTGKTELLGLRVANILRKDPDVAPTNILCLTFTDAAAWNIRDRLVGLIGRDAYRVAIHTFHSFGVEIINRYPEHFYHGASFLPADDITQIETPEDIFEDLDHGDPLRSEHNDQFVYLGKAKDAIGYIKKAGLTPDEFDFIITENKKTLGTIDALIRPVFSERISKKIFPRAEVILDALKKIKTIPLPGGFEPFSAAFGKALQEALSGADEYGTSPLTNWKKRWISRGDDGLAHLADSEDIKKMESMAFVYRSYVTRMRDSGYYDYNDMILDAIAELTKNNALRANLADQYSYILVDEFQDTNNAQMRLIGLLTDNSPEKGKTNIMVVGDDDQAIFKFQGAEISNILDFRKIYTDPKFVVLTANYRSTQDILNLARQVIQKGMTRLEKLFPDLVKKELIASGRDISSGKVFRGEFPSRDLEYQWIARETARLIKSGVRAREIAVIAPEHKYIEAIVPYFHAAKIPVAYEREENVLRMPHILQLVAMARFVDSVMRKTKDADDLLPEILNYPFWGIPRAIIWELSLKAYRERKPWLMVMRESDGKLRAIADFFLELGAKTMRVTAEEILHELIGGPQLLFPDATNEDDEGVIAPTHAMFSPFRSFYFGKNKFESGRADYLRFLSGLRSFVRALREYHPGRPVNTADMIAFFDTHTQNKLSINNVDSFANAESAVRLMVAHKSKGLEFEAVFVMNCEEGVWAGSGRGANIPLPSNLPIGPAGDTQDDKLRLFYVALTRAKQLLYLTSASLGDRGKKAEALSFLIPEEGEKTLISSQSVSAEDFGESAESLLVEQWNARHITPFVFNEKALLAPVLEKYQLSITHLQNFLNVADAGPIAFLEKNLLRFPEPITANSAFGLAVHATINSIYVYSKTAGKLPTEKEIISWFKEFLGNHRLNADDFARMLKRGEKALPLFYEAKKGIFSFTDITERDFQDQGVIVGVAPLTGKIDRMTIEKKKIVVCDFKTGKTIQSWEPGDSYEKIKAWRYRDQLVFYKLLIENSREFGGAYTVDRGIIQFVEPAHGHVADLEMVIETQEVKRFMALIAVVYKKIQDLDFPDISKYSKDIHGIRAFEEDLLR